jgi:dynactin complex subunit
MWEIESEQPGIQLLTPAEENMIFQSNYKETTQIKSSKVHGHGYMAKYRTRRELMKENLEVHARAEAAAKEKRIALDSEVEKLKEQLAHEAAEREREKEENRRKMQEDLENTKIAIREELKQEFLSMLVQQKEGTAIQVKFQNNFHPSPFLYHTYDYDSYSSNSIFLCRLPRKIVTVTKLHLPYKRRIGLMNSR